MLKIQSRFKKAITNQKIFLIFQINASELVVVNYSYYYDNTCSWQSTFLQALQKSMILLKMTVSNSSWLKRMRK